MRGIVSELGIEVEYPPYYVAEGSVDYAHVEEEWAFIRDTDTLFILRQMVNRYPLATARSFMHNKIVYTGGYVALLLDERNHLVYLNVYDVVDVPASEKKGAPCITWQKALESFLKEKREFSFEVFNESRNSTVTPDCVTICSMAPAMLYAQKTGEMTPIWELESKIEFEQSFPDGTQQHVTRRRQYHINAWTGEYMCYDP